MRFKFILHHRVTRTGGLLLLLGLTALAALWQQTSASSFEVPTATLSGQTTSTSAPRPATSAAGSAMRPDALTVVVNKQRALPVTYIPTGLTVPHVATRFGAAAPGSHLRPEAATALEQLFAAADREGLSLELLSGYRSAAYQASVYQTAVNTSGQTAANIAVARPGHSEHQTGLAADIGRPDHSCDLQACFGATPEGLWVAEHAATYGFIVRYPAGRTHLTGYQYEPWHLRYVGPATAQDIYRAGLILEDYFGLPYAPGY